MGKESVDLTSLSREELESKIRQLEAQNIQLKNILQNQENKSKDFKKLKKNNVKKEFDFSKHSKKHILLKFAYLGWNRQGFVVQDDTNNTVEAAVFDALCFTKLIESRETSNYHRCGRTDKGVSSFSQVISLTVRSRLPKESAESTSNDLQDELNYSQILNRVLPPDIRVIGWSSVPESFSARFNCVSRTYKYFFPRGKLNLELMNKAGELLVGEHDFRNFCKMDVGNGVVSFKRRISSIFIREMDSKEEGNLSESNKVPASKKGYRMCVATIEGVAFLWHQIRAIMTVLFLVGEGKEDPTVIEKLLDIKVVKRKPQYGLASEIGLNLYDVQYENVKWNYDEENLTTLISQLQTVWSELSIKSSMLHHMLGDLQRCLLDIFPNADVPFDQLAFCVKDPKTKVYKPLLKRDTCDSLEERVKHFVKRRRLNADVLVKVEKSEAEKGKNDQ